MISSKVDVYKALKQSRLDAKKDFKKRIKVTSHGALSTKSGAHGPILTPYIETLTNIRSMIVRDGATVVEVLADGKEITLTLENYFVDYSGSLKKSTDIKPVEKPVEKPEEKKEDTPKVDAPVKNENRKENKFDYKKNKNNNNDKKVVDAQ